MASPLVATRNTCFAVISGIEDDLRAFIRYAGETANLNEVLPSDVRDTAASRWQKEHQSEILASVGSDYELLPYSDFTDLAKILSSRIRPILAGDVSWIDGVTKQLLSLAPTRNRVCHSRPLEPDDLARTLDFANELCGGTFKDSFGGTREVLDHLKRDPGYVLRLQIPSIWATEDTKVHHNLPLPEFDDTGFLGRSADRKNVGKLLRSQYPVVTIVGEGGIGKTALAQRCLYDLLDDPDNPYEALVWVSLKTAALTPSGVQDVSNAITTTLGLLSSIAEALGAPTSAARSPEQLIAEISEYLKEFRVLLAIDNLETIASHELRPLLEAIPARSKIVFTSRVGIGEFEARYPLGPMDQDTCVTLFRTFARLLSASELYKADESILRNYSKRLFFNPLLIKWFVSGVARGGAPSAYLNREGASFEEALNFCFANLFERLGEAELSVINALASARQPLSAAELLFVTEEPDQSKLEWALGVLHNSSVLRRSQGGASRSLTYQLSEPVLTYISSKRRPSKEMFAKVQGRLRELKNLVERESVAQARYKYEIFSVRTGNSKDDRIAAVFLRRALDHMVQGNIPAARLAVGEAKRLTPLNSEVWRISGLIEGKADEPFKAFTDYEQAVSLDPSSTIARYSLVQYMLREGGDLDQALDHINAAIAADPVEPTLLSAKAHILVRLGRYPEAAPVYEGLLANIKVRVRRWRITTADQAAECYRRWAEVCVRDVDADGAKRHLVRAMEILRAAVKQHDWDADMVDRIGEVLFVANRHKLMAEEFASHITSLVEDIRKDMGDRPLHTRFTDAILDSDIPDDIRARLRVALTEEATSDPVRRSLRSALAVKPMRRVDATGERSGKVHNLQRGAMFGFIEEANGDRWFFHRNHLLAPKSWTKLVVGTPVSFHIGTNEKGPCAVNVRIQQ